MTTRRLLPATPPLSPLAELANTFEGTDPDACRLLRPVEEGLTRGKLEVRAHREFPERTAHERAAVVSRAEELLTLLDQNAIQNESRRLPAHVTGVENAKRDRLIGILVTAVQSNPALTAQEGYQLLIREPGGRIAKGTFYGAYWKRAIEQLPAPIVQLRTAMVSPRPAKKKVKTSPEDRVRIRALVGDLGREHPEWHLGQIMDEVRRITGLEFRDPIAFRRHYIDKGQGAPPAGKSAAEVPAPTVLFLDPPTHAITTTPLESAAQLRDLSPAVQHQVSPVTEPDGNLLGLLLAGVDPLKPAELLEVEGGGVELRLTLRPSALAPAYRVMSLLYGELASRNERPPRIA